jgi:hypothetical protein
MPLSATAVEERLLSYRCYLMSGEHIQAVRSYEDSSESDVVLKAHDLLKANPQHQAIEIWQGSRLVARLAQKPPGAADES